MGEKRRAEKKKKKKNNLEIEELGVILIHRTTELEICGSGNGGIVALNVQVIAGFTRRYQKRSDRRQKSAGLNIYTVVCCIEAFSDRWCDSCFGWFSISRPFSVDRGVFIYSPSPMN